MNEELIGWKGYLNDLWRYSNGSWTWMSGSSSVNAFLAPVQEVITTSNNNLPGSLDGSVSLVDSTKSFWAFGGYGCIVSYNSICSPFGKNIINEELIQ